MFLARGQAGRHSYDPPFTACGAIIHIQGNAYDKTTSTCETKHSSVKIFHILLLCIFTFILINGYS